MLGEVLLDACVHFDSKKPWECRKRCLKRAGIAQTGELPCEYVHLFATVQGPAGASDGLQLQLQVFSDRPAAPSSLHFELCAGQPHMNVSVGLGHNMQRAHMSITTVPVAVSRPLTALVQRYKEIITAALWFTFLCTLWTVALVQPTRTAGAGNMQAVYVSVWVCQQCLPCIQLSAAKGIHYALGPVLQQPVDGFGLSMDNNALPLLA